MEAPHLQSIIVRGRGRILGPGLVEGLDPALLREAIAGLSPRDSWCEPGDPAHVRYLALAVALPGLIARGASRREAQIDLDALLRAMLSQLITNGAIAASHERDRRWYGRIQAVANAWKLIAARHNIVGVDKYNISIKPGWLKLVDDMLAVMCAAGWDRRLFQIKSKNCLLRVHLGGASSAKIRAAIAAAKAIAALTCEHCSGKHGVKVSRSGVALCKACARQEEALRG